MNILVFFFWSNSPKITKSCCCCITLGLAEQYLPPCNNSLGESYIQPLKTCTGCEFDLFNVLTYVLGLKLVERNSIKTQE